MRATILESSYYKLIVPLKEHAEWYAANADWVAEVNAEREDD